MNIKKIQEISDRLMPDILKGPAAYQQKDPTKDTIVTTRQEGDKIIRTVQYPTKEEFIRNHVFRDEETGEYIINLPPEQADKLAKVLELERVEHKKE